MGHGSEIRGSLVLNLMLDSDLFGGPLEKKFECLCKCFVLYCREMGIV